jgi:hypothetical protein
MKIATFAKLGNISGHSKDNLATIKQTDKNEK